jgi:hypothetical protein
VLWVTTLEPVRQGNRGDQHIVGTDDHSARRQIGPDAPVVLGGRVVERQRPVLLPHGDD